MKLLRKLNLLASTQLTDAALRHLVDLPVLKMENGDVNMTKITRDGFDAFRMTLCENQRKLAEEQQKEQ